MSSEWLRKGAALGNGLVCSGCSSFPRSALRPSAEFWGQGQAQERWQPSLVEVARAGSRGWGDASPTLLGLHPTTVGLYLPPSLRISVQPSSAGWCPPCALLTRRGPGQAHGPPCSITTRKPPASVVCISRLLKEHSPAQQLHPPRPTCSKRNGNGEELRRWQHERFISPSFQACACHISSSAKTVLAVRHRLAPERSRPVGSRLPPGSEVLESCTTATKSGSQASNKCCVI